MNDWPKITTHKDVPRGTLYVVGLCTCMTVAGAPAREECPRCKGTGLYVMRMDGIRDRDEPRQLGATPAGHPPSPTTAPDAPPPPDAAA